MWFTKDLSSTADSKKNLRYYQKLLILQRLIQWDKIVLGIPSKSLQQKLLQVEKLDLNKPVEACKTDDATQAHINA